MTRTTIILGLFLLGLILPFLITVLLVSIRVSPYWGLFIIRLFLTTTLPARMIFSSILGWFFLGLLILGLILTWKTKNKIIAAITGSIAGIPLALLALLLTALAVCVTSSC